MKIKNKIAAALTAAYLAMASVSPAKAGGYINLFSHTDIKEEKTEPYGEVFISKKLSDYLAGELFAEANYLDGSLDNIYSELTASYTSTEKLPGLGLWAENVMMDGAEDFYRGGLMWSGSPCKDAFFLARIGYGTNMEGDDATARIIFNLNLDKGSVGFMVNSQSIASGHVYSEIPRLEYKLNEDISLAGEGVYMRNVIDDKVEEDLGVRAGLRVNF
ncbi:hypothetical protein GF345_00590 [Candidatus Woesearchaeota archaeon]|nr:hypothetical protein [Candidatus Woesearchaeota archaeon]